MDITARKDILFITDVSHIRSVRDGGVQICTKEYACLLQKAGFDIHEHAIRHTRNLYKRIKIKLGIGVYDRYDFEELFSSIEEELLQKKIEYVALNQVALSGFAEMIKARFGNNITVLLLSHGNESGDFLHEIVRTESKSLIHKARDIIRLGLFVFRESIFFARHVDLVLSMSSTELEINKWLGAKAGLFVPRTFSPDFLDLMPGNDRIGFVGTLDHLPNRVGLEQFLTEFEKVNVNKVKLRLVGGPATIGLFLENKFSCVKYLGLLDDEALKQEAASWSCSINPVFWYSRGASTKLAQLLNWGLPVVTTEAGNRGYTWTSGILQNARDAKDMAGLVVKITADSKLIEDCARQSRLVANSGPAMENIAFKLKSTLQDLKKY